MSNVSRQALAQAPALWQHARGLVGRYGLTLSGSVGISAAHFAASLILLRALPPAEFGLMAFVLVLVPFCLGISGALLGASVSMAIVRAKTLAEAELATHFKASLVLALVMALAIAALVFWSGGSRGAILAGTYGGLMALRWFARSYAFAMGQRHRVAVSDFAYGGLLLVALAILLAHGSFDLNEALVAFVLAVGVAQLVFGANYLRRLLASVRTGSLRAYGSIWRDLTRWSLLGVVLTEITANAHAYLVTFISGPGAFALLAIGSLLMRPVSLCLTALPDLERPLMARSIADSNIVLARRNVAEFTAATALVWLATAALAFAAIFFFPEFVLKAGYDANEVLIVVAFWAVIMAVRTFRTPESVFLQSAGEFRALAGASAASSAVSFALTLGLLFAFGPVASLAGILAGDAVMAAKIFSLSRAWRARRG
ncbi:MAG: hypothetical protein ACT4OG_02360 [Alphaproteobacteria bacterium]